MVEDEREQTEFDEELSRQEALNTEKAGNAIVPDEKITEEETVLEGVCPLSFEGNGAELFGILMKNLLLNLFLNSDHTQYDEIIINKPKIKTQNELISPSIFS